MLHGHQAVLNLALSGKSAWHHRILHCKSVVLEGLSPHLNGTIQQH